jgi:hypothetical protein
MKAGINVFARSALYVKMAVNMMVVGKENMISFK